MKLDEAIMYLAQSRLRAAAEIIGRKVRRAKMTLVDAIIAIARTDAKWAEFRQEAIQVPDPEWQRHRDGRVPRNDDVFAEMYLAYYCLVTSDPPMDDGWSRWKEYFVWRFLEEASDGRCRVSGFVGMNKREIPAGVFESLRLADNLMNTNHEFAFNELTLPDDTTVTAIEVEFPAQVEGVTPAAEETLPFPRRGPKTGEVRRYDKPDSAFLPELEELIRSGKSKTAAATAIAERGEMAGPATIKRKANRLIELYNDKSRR